MSGISVPMLSSSIRGLFDVLFRRHSGELLNFAERQMGGDDAEDIVQEAYLRFFQHPDPSSIENPRAYLYKTTANLGKNRFRAESVRRGAAHEEAVDPDSLASSAPEPEAVTDGVIRLERFVEVLDELPEMHRHAFVLHKMEHLSYAEVAEALGISPKTAQRYILKAWQHCLMRLGGDLSSYSIR